MRRFASHADRTGEEEPYPQQLIIPCPLCWTIEKCGRWVRPSLSFEQEKTIADHWLDAKEKRERENVPSFDPEVWVIGIASAGNDGRDDYDFGFFVVLRKFDLDAALGELTSG